MARKPIKWTKMAMSQFSFLRQRKIWQQNFSRDLNQKSQKGVIHILRNHQGGGGFRMITLM